jgi:hypothetical protein
MLGAGHQSTEGRTMDTYVILRRNGWQSAEELQAR